MNSPRFHRLMRVGDCCESPGAANAPWTRVAVTVLLLSAAYLASGAMLIKMKALLAPVLIEQAWQQMLTNPDRISRPWPWADTWPIARMQLPGHGVDLPILTGDAGNSLAFAPGHSSASAPLGSGGLAVIGAHRDTHFAFLENVRVGDALRLQLRDGAWRNYEVVSLAIADTRLDPLPDEGDRGGLLLITCYPFSALTVNGPLRYVVQAEPIEQPM